MHLRNLHVIPFEKRDQHVREKIARIAIEASHNAEVYRTEHAIRAHEHVAGMHIGVEEAVAKDLVEEDTGRLLKDRARRNPGGFQGINLVDRGTFDPLQR